MNQPRAGNRTTNRAPRPSSGSSSVTVPSCDCATARTIARPRPLEPLRSPAPRKKRSVTFRHADDADFERELNLERRVRDYAAPRAVAA